MMFGRNPYRRQMRRARRAWREGAETYPILFVGPDEPLGFVLLAAAGRWAFRHRSAFAPVIITLAVFVAAAMVHSHHADWWIPVTAITIVVTLLLGFPHKVLRRHPVGRRIAYVLAGLWEACWIERAVERTYASTVVAVTGGWLAAAIANGPTTKPLPLVAVNGCVVLGIPWWLHRRRRAKVRVERTITSWPNIAEKVGLSGSHIASVVVDAWGWTMRVVLRKGTTADQAISKMAAIESGFGLRPGSVRIFPDQTRADRFIMRVIENDPHSEPIPWPGPSITSVTKPVEIGLSEDGHPVYVVVLRRNVLIGGIAGSGKSGILNVIIGALVSCHDVVLWGVDLKGGMELQPWAVCFDRLATTPQEANELFKDAVGWLNRRAREKAERGERVLDPSSDDPALIILVDEYAELSEESHDCADSIARRGRAVAINLIAATQRPTQTAMGKDTAVRSQMDVRICLRVRERRDVDLILGQGSFNSGWHAHQLTQPGEFLISDPEHTNPEGNRAYLLTDERIARHAAQHAHHRPVLPAGGPARPQTAAGPLQTAEQASAHGRPDGPQTVLWTALADAGPEGVSVVEMLALTGMTRPTLYRHLQAHAKAGRAVQVTRGHWRAAGCDRK